MYYVPSRRPDPYPPNITDYLNSIRTRIGADTDWEFVSEQVYLDFAETGDWMHNSAPDLERIVDAGVGVFHAGRSQP